MRNFSGKFEQICETALTRFQQRGFLLGDYIKFRKDALKQDCVKGMSDQLKSIIDACIKNDTVLKISDVKSPNAEAPSGPVGAANVPGCLWADVYVEHAPGMFSNVMTIPLSIVDKIYPENEAEGYRPYDKKLIRKNKTDNNTDRDTLRKQQTMVDDETRKTPTKNTKLAFTREPKDGRH